MSIHYAGLAARWRYFHARLWLGANFAVQPCDTGPRGILCDEHAYGLAVAGPTCGRCERHWRLQCSVFPPPWPGGTYSGAGMCGECDLSYVFRVGELAALERYSHLEPHYAGLIGL